MFVFNCLRNIQGILRDFWDVSVIHVLVYVFESDFFIKEICFGATSWVWLSCSLSKFLGEFIEDEDEDEFDLKEIQENDRRRRDILDISSNIIAIIWFHRNASVGIYVTKFLGSGKIS